MIHNKHNEAVLAIYDILKVKVPDVFEALITLLRVAKHIADYNNIDLRKILDGIERWEKESGHLPIHASRHESDIH